METRICCRCGLEKNISEFYKSDKWYRTDCKKCTNERNKNNYLKNKSKRSEYLKLKYQENKEYKKQMSKDYYYKNKNKISEKAKKYYDKNKEKIKEKSKEYILNHQEERKQYNKKYRINNKKILNNKHNLKMKNDKIYNFKHRIRALIRKSFIRRKITKNSHTTQILGCSIENFINHLINSYQKTYNEKWNWENIEKVHIDHIVPLSTANNEEEIIKLCHYTNLQLLKEKDNLNKKDKLDWSLEK